MFASLAGAVGLLALLTIVPGPDMAVVTRAALSGSRRAAERTAGGVVTGLLVWGLLAVAGLAAVLAASADAYTAIRLVGAAYLVWLGLRVFWASRRRCDSDAATGHRRPRGSWRTGLVANLMNPKVGVFYTSVLPQLVPAGAPMSATQAGLVLTHAGLSWVWLNAWARALRHSRGALRRPSVSRPLERLTGAVLVGLGLEIAVRTG
jgi:threonine/homoserine/homoserine lactone efflux protein